MKKFPALSDHQADLLWRDTPSIIRSEHPSLSFPFQIASSVVFFFFLFTAPSLALSLFLPANHTHRERGVYNFLNSPPV